jgi:hypothetical protein
MHSEIQKAANRQQQLKKEMEMKSHQFSSVDKRGVLGV